MSCCRRSAKGSRDLEKVGISRFCEERFFAGGGDVEASTRVVSDGILRMKGDGSLRVVGMGLPVGCAVEDESTESACGGGIAGMDVECGCPSLSS